MAPLIAASGFTRRDDGRYFHRDCGDGVVQVLSVFRGLGELADGTSLHDKIQIHYGVCLPEAQLWPMPDDPARVPPAYATLSSSTYTSPDPMAVAEALQTTVLSWLEATAGRGALAAWAGGDPERIFPPAQRPLLARLFTEWGHATSARVILDHLDRDWPSLARNPDALSARHGRSGDEHDRSGSTTSKPHAKRWLPPHDDGGRSVPMACAFPGQRLPLRVTARFR